MSSLSRFFDGSNIRKATLLIKLFNNIFQQNKNTAYVY